MENNRTFKDITKSIVYILLGVAVVVNIYLEFAPNSVLMFIKEVAWDKDNTRIYLATGMDKFLKKTAPEGNIILKFNGFPQLTDASKIDTPLIIYMRSVFRLYPRRVFAVPENIVVNKGRAIQEHPLKADDEWMASHGIRKVITLTKEKNGGVYTKVDDIQPRTQGVER